MATRQHDTMMRIDPARIADLEAAFAGNLATSDQSAFDSANALWNGMIDQQPALVVRPRGVADVQRAIGFARAEGLEISIKGGGHNIAGYATTDGGMMIDLESLRQIWVDPKAGTARAGGGARWTDFDRETGVFGLATTGGVISTTGVAGLTLGGGVGWLVGKYGLASDNLISADIVTADGEAITASDSEHSDLFWAIRGGGGNFGVVTSFEFEVHPQPTVFAGMVAHPPEMAPEVLAFYREFTANAPDELTVYCAHMPEPEQGQRVSALAFCWSGDPARAEEVVRPILDFGDPIMTIADHMPFAVWNGANDALFPWGRRYYWKSAMLRDLDDGVLEAVADFAANPPLHWLNVTIEHYAGAMNRLPPDATAFPHRDAHYQVVIVGVWDDPAEDAIGREWARDLYNRIKPFAKDGDYLNFVALDDATRQDRIRAGYGHNWERLVEVKRRYDPDNVFHRNNTIVP